MPVNTYALDETSYSVSTPESYATPQTTFTVKGRVSDSEGNGIPGATVRVKGTQKGTTSTSSNVRESSYKIILIVLSLTTFSAET